MINLTKMNMAKPAHDVFEAFVDPSRIGKFWFSSSSARWEEGKTVTLRYDEYDAEVDIRLLSIEADRKIVFRWGDGRQGNTVTILLKEQGNGKTEIEVMEDGFQENDDNLLPTMVDNKEGWVYMLTCLKGYLEYGVVLRGALVK